MPGLKALSGPSRAQVAKAVAKVSQGLGPQALILETLRPRLQALVHIFSIEVLKNILSMLFCSQVVILVKSSLSDGRGTRYACFWNR